MLILFCAVGLLDKSPTLSRAVVNGEAGSWKPAAGFLIGLSKRLPADGLRMGSEPGSGTPSSTSAPGRQVVVEEVMRAGASFAKRARLGCFEDVELKWAEDVQGDNATAFAGTVIAPVSAQQAKLHGLVSHRRKEVITTYYLKSARDGTTKGRRPLFPHTHMHNA